MSIDGTILDLADSTANAEFFGRPPVSLGEQSAFPQARLVALAECGTHAILDAVMGPCATSEIELSRELAGRFKPGMLVLADRGFYGFRLWAQAAATTWFNDPANKDRAIEILMNHVDVPEDIAAATYDLYIDNRAFLPGAPLNDDVFQVSIDLIAEAGRLSPDAVPSDFADYSVLESAAKLLPTD